MRRVITPRQDREDGLLRAVLGELVEIGRRALRKPAGPPVQRVAGGAQQIGAEVGKRRGLAVAPGLELAQSVLVRALLHGGFERTTRLEVEVLTPGTKPGTP